MKKLITITLCCVLCLGLISCSATTSKNEQTATEPTSTTESINIELSITEEDATKLIETMYSDYTVKNDKTSDNVMYFSIIDNGNEYATVKVDLVTADGYETLASDNSNTTFNLLG